MPLRPRCVCLKRMAAAFTATAIGALLIFMNGLSSHAADASSNSPAKRSPWPHERSNLSPDPAIVFGALENGFRFALMPNAKPAQRVSMHLNVPVGSLNETEAERGVAHFLEHLQFNGSVHFPPGELVKYFQRIGMEFGPDANAHTGCNETVYDVLLPDNKEESIRVGLLVLSDYAQGALLLESEIDRERRVVLAEKRSRDSVSYRTFVETLTYEFPETRLPHRLPIGHAKVIENVRRETIEAFYRAHYRPESMMVVVVGDIDIARVEGLVDDAFGSLTAKAPSRPVPDIGTIRHRGIGTFFHYEKEAGETTVRIEAVERVPEEPDSRARRIRKLTEDVADRIIQHRLNTLLDKPDAPFTSADIGSGVYLKEVAYAEISAECDPEDWEAALQALENTLRQALDFGVSAAEVSRVKREMQAEMDRLVQQSPTRLSQSIARDIIRNVNAGKVLQSPEQKRQLYGPVLEALTPEAVTAAFRRVWAKGHRLILVTGNATIAPPDQSPEERIRAAYDRCCKVTVVRPTDRDRALFPYLPIPKKTPTPVVRKRIASLDATRLEFGNHVTAHVKQTPFNKDDIQVRVTFGPGWSGEPDARPGIARMAEDVVNESGVGRLTKENLRAALAGTSIDLEFSVKEDRFMFEGQAVRRDFETLLQLIYTQLVDPVFREDARQLSIRRYNQQYKARASTVRGAMRIYGLRLLAGGDLRFGMPSEIDFAARTTEEVESWLMPYLKHSALDIAVVGDVEPDVAAALIARYFGTLPQRGGIPEMDAPVRSVRFPDGRRFDVPLPTRIENSLLVMAYPTADVWDISRTRRLSVLAEIINEQLRVNIREALGVAYSPYATHRPSRAFPGYGALLVFVELAPEETDQVEKAVLAMIDQLITAGVNEDQLRRAVDPTLTSIRDMRRDNRYWIDTVLAGAARHPEQLTWSQTIASDYASITPDQVDALAEVYLKPDRMARIVFRPGTPPAGAAP